MSTRLAVLASGRGSNLRALHEYLSRSGRDNLARLSLVLSDHADAGALSFARSRDIATAAIDGGTLGGDRLLAQLSSHRIDLVVLAGYMRLVPEVVVHAYRGRIVNVHPALLPAFGGRGMYGTRVHGAVIAAGARVSGATVHFVDERYDHGAIIAQWPVPVLSGDTPQELAARVLRVEHALYPPAVLAVAQKRIALDDAGHATHMHLPALDAAAFVLDSLDDAALRNAIGIALSA
ncbi:MAG TPA: phosphoribosylglycinamide formyltransferase [Gemmatimonadaceae bacterium]|jgi:formyltetrahydrofolate-dependent phosphoribosylglycinamide formyltransferase|nr:phosphoribosylglycinamide formyltransferase [Gemmatimonadaceae bacterium]